ncbi:hypothetical protein N7448_011055 [Penicillium atrosanguineum]|nr:hypothetical protein N7448_011055 [Penicillium atrosanguineum]
MAAQSNAITWQTKLPISSEVPDLTDKVTLVTGAKGMGFHAAYQLAFKNAKVYIGARSASKAESAIQEMKSQNPRIGEEKLVPFVADLSDIRAVRAAARAVLMNESRLDILIHNAAVHLGPFVLTNELIPLLKQTAGVSQDVRVIVVSAASYKFLPEGIRFDSLASFNAEMEPTIYGGADFTRYIRINACYEGLSKLANLLFARQLQKYFEVTGIDAISISLHPGLIKTGMVLIAFTFKAYQLLSPPQMVS